MSKTMLAFYGLLLSINAAAADVSHADLVGLWEFTAYAEASEPEARRTVGAVFDIRSDGTLITTTSTGKVEARLDIKGDTITYSDAKGEQLWKVHSLEPDESLVILNRGTLMFLEKQ